MAAPSKSDQLRQLRERAYEAMMAKAQPAAKKAKLVSGLAVVANAMANKPSPDGTMANVTSTYKYRDPAARRAYQRDLMRRRRSDEKSNGL